jgi:hypothetical protein
MRLPNASLAPLAALAFAVLSPGEAASDCRGRISGDLKEEFSCLVSVVPSEDGTPVFTITAKDVIPEVPVYKPGSFLLPSPPKKGTYRLADLGMGMASLAIDGGALYTATKTSSQRGEVTLALTSVKPDPARPGAYEVRGSYHARLLPAGSGKTGEIVFDVSF